MTKTEIQQVKQRFGIIGNTEALLRAIDVAIQVAPTDLSVLITGESGVEEARTVYRCQLWSDPRRDDRLGIVRP